MHIAHEELTFPDILLLFKETKHRLGNRLFDETANYAIIRPSDPGGALAKFH